MYFYKYNINTFSEVILSLPPKMNAVSYSY